MGWRYLSKIVKCVHRPKIQIEQVRTSMNLSYKIVGDNDIATDPDSPPVFLLHGIFGSKRDWEGIGKTILTLTKRVVVTVDLRNHGDSPHDSTATYEVMAKDVIQLLKKLSVTRVSLIGHGLGGMTAMCIALREPPTVAGILVVDMSPIEVPQPINEYYYKILMTLKEIDLSKFKKVRVARKVIKKKLRGVVARNDDTTKRLILANVDIQRSTSTRTIGWTCNLDALIKNFNDLMKLPRDMRNKIYKGPTLFIGGQLSDSLNPDDLPDIRALFPAAVIIYVPKSGHFVHIDDPQTFLEYTISFLRTNTLKDS